MSDYLKTIALATIIITGDSPQKPVLPTLEYKDTDSSVVMAGKVKFMSVGKEIVKAQSISGLGVTRDAIIIRSGGDNDTQYVLPGKPSYSPITLKHVTTQSQLFSEWIFSGLGECAVKKETISIYLYKMGETGAHYDFTLSGVFPTRWELGGLEIKSNSSSFETITFSYDKLTYKYYDK